MDSYHDNDISSDWAFKMIDWIKKNPFRVVWAVNIVLALSLAFCLGRNFEGNSVVVQDPTEIVAEGWVHVWRNYRGALVFGQTVFLTEEAALAAIKGSTVPQGTPAQNLLTWVRVVRIEAGAK